MSVDVQVERERLRMIAEQSSSASVATLLLAALVASATYGLVHSPTLVFWFAMVVLACAARWTVAQRVGKVERAEHLASARLGLTLTVALCGGAIGSGAALFCRPGSPGVFVLFALLVCGTTAGASSSLSADARAHSWYATVCLLPAAITFVAVGGVLAVGGVMTFIFWGASLAFARRTQRAVLEALRLRIERDALVEQLLEQTARAQAAQRAAEDANRAKSKFLAAASHDLRQPLHAQGLFMAALQTKLADDLGSLDLVAKVEKSNRALGSLLDALLDVSRLDAAALHPQVEPVPVAALLEYIAQEMAPLAEAKGLTLRTYAEDAWVMTDRGMLLRILRNLVSNAIRYTERGTVLVASRRGDPLRLQVFDTGLGIAPEHLDEIFEEFRQLHNEARDRRAGLGLGLAIVRRVAGILEHPLSVRSVPGRGSCFSVSVPRCAPGRRSTEAPCAVGAFAGLRVLLIDDELDVRQAVQDLLDAWGCVPFVAGSGHDARAIVEAQGPVDVVIADYRLGKGENGLDVIESLRRSQGSDFAALVITGDTHPDRIVEACRGAHTLLHKPLTGEALQDALRRSRAQRAIPE